MLHRTIIQSKSGIYDGLVTKVRVYRVEKTFSGYHHLADKQYTHKFINPTPSLYISLSSELRETFAAFANCATVALSLETCRVSVWREKSTSASRTRSAKRKEHSTLSLCVCARDSGFSSQSTPTAYSHLILLLLERNG